MIVSTNKVLCAFDEFIIKLFNFSYAVPLKIRIQHVTTTYMVHHGKKLLLSVMMQRLWQSQLQTAWVSAAKMLLLKYQFMCISIIWCKFLRNFLYTVPSNALCMERKPLWLQTVLCTVWTTIYLRLQYTWRKVNLGCRTLQEILFV